LRIAATKRESRKLQSNDREEIQTFNKEVTLHMYIGMTRLSFCEVAASNKAERRTARK